MSNAIPSTGSDVDIVSVVEADHRALRAMLAGIVEVPGAERASLWPELLHALAVHEVARRWSSSPP